MKGTGIMLTLALLFMGLPFSLRAQNIALIGENDADVFVPIGKYIQQGDAESLSAWFAENLEMTILGKSNDCCSKSQAKEIMQAFFDANHPHKFEIIHKSGENIMRHAIGRLYCTQNNYSVTVTVLIGEKGNHIQILKIENN